MSIPLLASCLVKLISQYYSEYMNKASLTRNAFGIAVVGVGILALLGSVGLYDFGNLAAQWWPLLVIFAGVIALISNPRQFVVPLAIVAVGVLFQLRQFDIVSFDVWQLFWPIIIISIGVSILMNRTVKNSKEYSADSTNLSVYFSGSETRNGSQDYKGGNISTAFGGVELDLRDAKIKGTATLNVSVILGGLELRVPREWNIESRVTPILGGVESRALNNGKAGAPTLIITGDVILGGVDIKQ